MIDKSKSEKFEVLDQSGDHKYFTMIPNCIVNGSTAMEQALYIQLKRYAGESGKCFVSARTLAKKMGSSHSTVFKYLEKLIARGWIRKEGSMHTGARPANCYSVVDIWKENVGRYEKNE